MTPGVISKRSQETTPGVFWAIRYPSWGNGYSNSSTEPANLVVEDRGGDDAVVEVPQIEMLVGCVRVLVRQSDAEEHRGNPELFLERGDDRNGADLTAEHGRCIEALLDGASCRAHERVVVVGDP